MSSKIVNNNLISEEFQKIFNAFTKEIIRYHPKDIIDFSYKYFYSLENNIPFTYSTKKIENLAVNIDSIINQKETVHSTLEQNDSSQGNKNDFENDEKIIEKNLVTPRSDNDINDLEEPELVVPVGGEIGALIKKKEDEEEMKKRPASSYSKISDTDEQKKGVKDFISDLFFD